MYVEQEMYYVNGDIHKTISGKKNMYKDDLVWILSLESFRIPKLHDS